ncbi:hypothetical protein FCULG_00009031 [Fusarium culmorum]|uniref:Uncharacterized protein n=1 Tax=Fusarium culmorum TaxID=5516 RepID=A0A2T4GGM9_FUSCU|nr:hypothetical protein FCULG_00009031 [Fusarium culmorum]
MEPSGLSCEHCGERFQRREHRDRHLLRHTGHKPFQCDVCSKSFPRHDTLVRHRTLHDTRSGSHSRGRRPRGKACVACSRLKQGCSGGNPCSRCKSRGTVCIYNSAKSSDVPSRDNDQHGALSSPSTARATDLGDEDTMSCDDYNMPNEWNDAPSIPSGISNVPTLYTTVANNSPSTWQPTQHLSHENFSGLFPIPGVPWMPWNPLMDSSSFPWLAEGLEISLGFPNLPDLMDTSPIVVENAASPATHLATVSAPAIPPSSTINKHTDPQTYIHPEHICSSYTKPCLPFPKLQDIGIQMARAELFGHIHDIPQQAIEGLNDFYKTQQRDNFTEAIPHDILHAFVELYFEYFDPQFPFLHPSRVEDPGLSWLLLLAVAAVGSHYTEIQVAEEYNLALSDLLARAVEQSLSNHITQVETATVQSVFLLHVLWMFSNSHRDKVLLKHKRSSLSTLCWDLLSRANKRRHQSQPDIGTEGAWQTWLTTESEIRLVTCVRLLECLGHIFLFMPLSINLPDATKQLPCDERVWKTRSALDWKSKLETCVEAQPVISGQGCLHSRSNGLSTKDPFPCKVALIELYLDERDISHQLLTSKILRSSFASYFGSESSTDAQRAFEKLDTRSLNPQLDAIIDQLTFANSGTGGDTIFHCIAILRLIPIPLETLHFATGWQANKEQMLESKMRLRDFFQNNSSKARKALWHAVCIFKTTRKSQRLMCYDAFSLISAMGYIYSYSEARSSLSEGSPDSHASPRPPIVRLDQLNERSDVERWIDNDTESLVHLTGVGLLDGSDHCVRFLRDLEKTFSSQIAWRGFVVSWLLAFPS